MGARLHPDGDRLVTTRTRSSLRKVNDGLTAESMNGVFSKPSKVQTTRAIGLAFFSLSNAGTAFPDPKTGRQL
jgi:hypothetical protein